MSFYFATKFCILSPMNVMKWFILKLGFIGIDGTIRNYTMISNRQKPIIILVGTLISKIGVFGTQKIHTWSYRSLYTHYEWLFAAACGVEAWLTHIFCENENGAFITVHGDNYSNMMTDFFVLSFHGTDVNDVCFQFAHKTHLISQSIYCIEPLIAAKELQFYMIELFSVGRC